MIKNGWFINFLFNNGFHLNSRLWGCICLEMLKIVEPCLGYFSANYRRAVKARVVFVFLWLRVIDSIVGSLYDAFSTEQCRVVRWLQEVNWKECGRRFFYGSILAVSGVDWITSRRNRISRIQHGFITIQLRHSVVSDDINGDLNVFTGRKNTNSQRRVDRISKTECQIIRINFYLPYAR
jgi:hypothetical protein